MLFQELVVSFGIIALVNSQMSDIESMYLNFFVQLESVKKSVDILKLQLETKNEKPCCTCPKPLDLIENLIKQEEAKDKFRQLPKSTFDIRIDTLPTHCNSNDNAPPSNCAKATECTHASGYYNISVYRYNDRSFMAFCDIKLLGGDWLYILRRQDGSENFTRPWSDYVNGFGNVDNEYWIGLENLYALTNFDGPQELYVYIENWEGETRYAKYDHFVIGSANENYKLKTLGKYSGNAGDSLRLNLNQSFSTYDSPAEKHTFNVGGNSGWWHVFNGDSNPTGIYYQGGTLNTSIPRNGLFWYQWKRTYSFKTMNLMIRRQKL